MGRVTPGAPGNFSSGGGGSSEITNLVGITSPGQEIMDNSLPVVIASDQSAIPVSQSGTWNVNNVSGTISLPTGAATLAEQQSQTTHLSNTATSLSVVDDWDETNRAKVNLIPSEAGITGGAGVVASNTPRVTLASDDPSVASLSVLDDWDESDRAKINPIVGQAGVQGGSGAVSTTTQRVVLATDVALPTGTNVIGRVGHDITGIGHGVTTVTTAGTDVVLAGSTACKKVVIQAQTDNTGYIAVGGSGVDATVATGTGILLSPGDVFIMTIDNLADIFIDSTVNGEGVRYTYFT